MEKRTIKAADDDAGARLDKVLARHIDGYSRARLQQLIEGGQVSSSGKSQTDCSHKVRAGDVFTVTIPPAIEAVPEAQAIDLDIVYEDKDLLVINKTAKMVVHPGAGNHDGTLVNALLAHCGDTLSGIGGVKRPGIVHRLDKETSGLMVVAKNDAAHQGLSEQLSSRSLKRVYHAIVWGNVTPPSGRIETQIGRSRTNRQKMAVLQSGGREAVTDYKLIKSYGLLASMVECRLQTGRTHQIRVHMAHLQHWLVGDPVYGKPAMVRFLKLHGADEGLSARLRDFPRQALHAAAIEFIHPISKNRLSFKAPMPDDMMELTAALEKFTRKN